MKTQLGRRHFLRGMGTLIALPALESIGFRRFASAASQAPATPPKRMVFLGFGFGVTKESWFPDVKQTGAGYDLPKGLAPLARHKADFTVVQGCSNQYTDNATEAAPSGSPAPIGFPFPGKVCPIASPPIRSQPGNLVRTRVLPLYRLAVRTREAPVTALGYLSPGTSAVNRSRDSTRQYGCFTNCSPPTTCRWNNARPPSPKNAACWMPL